MQSLYNDKQMGLSAIQKHLQETLDLKVSVGFLSNRLNDYNIKRRTCSEARRIVANSLDWNISLLSPEIEEWMQNLVKCVLQAA